MKRIILSIAIMLFTWHVIAQDISKIDFLLQQEMSTNTNNELIRINIILKSQYDQNVMRSKTNAFPAKEAKRNFVINELKTFSNETQNDIKELLNQGSKNAQVSDIKSYWIVNFINCYADNDMIELLATHPDILTIGYDREEQVLFGDDNERIATETTTREIVDNVVKVQADQVWELGYKGQEVIVAVLDTGVNYNHTDLEGNMWEHPDYPYHGFNIINNNNNPMDDHGHGSHCAGTIAGQGASGSQTGMAPEAKIMAVKVLNSQGGSSLSACVGGIEFAVEKGAHILSLSLGFASDGSYAANSLAFRNAMVNVLEAGVVASVAVGNEGDSFSLWLYPVPQNVRTPGNCPPPWLHPDQTTIGGISAVVCVGATDNNDQAAYFTSHGPVTWQSISAYGDYPYNPEMGLIRPDVTAPGVNVKSLRYNNNTGYTFMDGTSMATPCVAGVMALMLSKNSELTPAEICEILETTAVPLSSSKSNILGSGRVDALAAIHAIAENSNIILDGFSINDSQGNNNGKLNPGETLSLSVSMKNDSDMPASDVKITLSISDELVTIINGDADFGDFDANEVKSVENAFTLSLSEEADAHHEIICTLQISAEGRMKKVIFPVIVYNHVVNILQVDISGASKTNMNEGTDIWIYLKNSGNQEVCITEAKLASDSPYMTVNEYIQSYGYLYPNQYKYRIYNVNFDENIPDDIDEIPFTLLLIDENGKEFKDSSVIRINNADDPVPTCNEVVDLKAVVNTSGVNLSWKAGGDDVDSYFIYCDNEFLAKTTEFNYNHPNINEGRYNYCVEALYIDGCTSYFACVEADIECVAPVSLITESVSENAILLSWTSPSDAERVYNIYRDFELLAANISENSYTDQELDPLAVYCYTVTAVCYGNLESNESDVVCHSLTGLNKIDQKINIYPNPTQNIFYIEGTPIKSVIVFDMLGKKIIQTSCNDSKISIDMSSYSQGIYLIEIETAENIKINRKIIVAQ
ncbi:MAG: S8 family serine peptidase [Bacteroidales bacterium]|jgi:subtilisin family serine protease|nr:S8 family serine peptidase [Bacteroidales bacterium]